MLTGIITKHVDSIPWQDYRGSSTGMIVYYNTDPVSEMPIREVPEEIPSGVIAEPNYETGTYGVYGCKHARVRSAFAKKKLRYLFFMTRYAGTKTECVDDLMVTGYYRVKRTADVQKLHVRYLNDYSCLGDDACIALRADEMHFLCLDDALRMSPEVLEKWAVKTRITRQTKILLDEENTGKLLDYIHSKPNALDAYLEETERLWPALDDEEEEDDEEVVALDDDDTKVILIEKPLPPEDRE